MMMGAIRRFTKRCSRSGRRTCATRSSSRLEAWTLGGRSLVADAATLRRLQWLASGLLPVDRGVTVDAVRQNLRDGCGVTATEAQVAGWLRPLSGWECGTKLVTRL